MNLIEKFNKAYAELRANPEAWAAAQAEREVWDATLLDGLEEEEMSKKPNEGEITAYIDVLASSAAAVLRALKASEGDERRKIVAGISKAAMVADVDAEAAGALAHLLNTHGH